MKLFVVFLSSCAIALADSAGQGGYSSGGSGYPTGGSFNFGNGGYSTGGNSFSGFGATGESLGQSNGGSAGGYSGPSPSDAPQGPQVFKYVSIHTAPEDPEDSAARTLRVPGGNNKHVNIIFVKTPSNGADQKTEIVLPEQDQTKSLVYVLLKKSDPTANLKIKKPEASPPSKPEVYFIRYKNNAQIATQPGSDGQIAGGAIPVGDFKNASPQYSAPLSSTYGAP